MAKRTRVSTGTALELKFRYSRAVRVGDLVFVSGTTAMKDGVLVGVGDAGVQTRQILANIVWALGQAGASANDVVRNRIYLTKRATSAIGVVTTRTRIFQPLALKAPPPVSQGSHGTSMVLAFGRLTAVKASTAS